jgi:hypothetical protein
MRRKSRKIVFEVTTRETIKIPCGIRSIIL